MSAPRCQVPLRIIFGRPLPSCYNLTMTRQIVEHTNQAMDAVGTTQGFPVAVASWLTYLADYRGHSPLTIKAYADELGRFGAWIATAVGRMCTIADMDRPLVLSYFSQCSGGAYAKRRTVAVLRGFCGWLCWNGYIDRNPVVGIPVPRIPSPRPQALSEADMRGMMLVARRRPWQWAMLWLMAGCGLRRAEVCGLTTEDLDLRECTLRVYGKGRRYRVMPLSPPVWDAISAYLPHRRPQNGSIKLLLDERGVPVNRFRVYDAVKALAEQAGVDPARVSPHTFRRTFATLLNRQGTDIRTIQELLGHADISTTMRYIEVDANRKRKAVASLWGG